MMTPPEPPALPRLATRLFNTPLLMEPDKLQTILAAVGPRFEGKNAPPREAPAAARRSYSLAGGIAVLPVLGTLVQRHDWLAAASGLTSYERLAGTLRQAVADPEAEAILLDLDSPGGEVAGAFDLADQIYAARQVKPVWAVANELAASAAYALASAAERVFVTRTALVGSVGVILAHRDQSALNEKQGVRYTMIYAGARKNDFSPHAPLTAEAFAFAQGHVNEIYDLFLRTVARNRGLSAAAVRDTEAALFMGEQAVRAGLADAVGTLADAVEQLHAALASSGSTPTLSTPNKENVMTQPTPTPAADAAALEAARAAACGEERARVQGILQAVAKLDVPAAFAAHLVAEGLTLPEATTRLIDYRAEHSPARGIAGTGAVPVAPEGLDPADRAALEWERDPQLRGEFTAKDDYVAFRKAEAKGLVRILRK